MAHQKAVGAAGKAPVGNQRHAAAQSHALQHGGGGQHFGHARPALRPLVANHHHIAPRNIAALAGGYHVFFAIEDPRRAAEAQTLFAGNFGDCAIGREVAGENANVAVRLERRRYRAHNFLSLGKRGALLQILRQGGAGDGEAIAVQQPRFEQQLHHRRRAPHGLQVFHHKAAAGTEICEQRHAVAHGAKIADVQRHRGGPGHGQQMQH